MSHEDKKDEYKGPGKFTAAVGRGMVEGAVGNIIGTAVGAGVGAMTKNKGEGALIGSWIGGTATGLVGFVHGAYRGVKNVDAAQKQIAETSADLRVARAEADQQKSFVETLSKERIAEAAQDDKTPKR